MSKENVRRQSFRASGKLENIFKSKEIRVYKYSSSFIPGLGYVGSPLVPVFVGVIVKNSFDQQAL